MGVICKEKVVGGGGGGGGQLGYKNIWCEKVWKMKVIVALISVSSHPVYTVHAQNIWIGVKSENMWSG